jgi:arylsulfatase A-like enzyme
VVIVADDLGYADVGVQGCKDIPTPNLDRLANGGMRCTAGYVMPWCAPARHSLITGCWPGRAAAGAKQSGKGIVPAPLPRLFADAGYATAVFGKVHGHDTTGFQDALHFNGANYKGGRTGGRHAPLIRNGQPFEYDEYMTDLFTRFGVSWIKKNKDRPFFLYMPYQAVKNPVPPTAELMKRAGKLPGLRGPLAATMIGPDDGVGRLLDALRENGLEDNSTPCRMRTATTRARPSCPSEVASCSPPWPWLSGGLTASLGSAGEPAAEAASGPSWPKPDAGLRRYIHLLHPDGTPRLRHMCSYPGADEQKPEVARDGCCPHRVRCEINPKRRRRSHE